MSTSARLEELYLPDPIQAFLSGWGEDGPRNFLLERSLDTPDWSLEQLWEAAAYHHIHYAFPKAMRYYHRLLEWTEHNPEAHGQVLMALGHAHLSSGRVKDAQQVLEIALKMTTTPKLYLYLADCATRQGDSEQAIGALRRFLELYTQADVLAAKCYRQLASLLDGYGDSAAAREILQTAARQLASPLFAIQADSYQAILPLSLDLPKHSEQPELAGITENQPIYFEEIGEWYPYRAVWQQENLRESLTTAARALRAEWPEVKAESSSGKRIVFVGGFHRPEAEPYLDAMIALSRKLPVSVFTTGPIPARLREEEWMRVTEIPDQALILHEQIARLGPALVIYLDLGPHSGSSLMVAGSRPAPVQAVLPAYPLTSGHPDIDYFLSYDWLEPDSADDAYAETLVRLVGMPAQSSGLPDRYISREQFNLPADQRFYFCPLSCASLHPDFVSQIAEILNRDPQGMVLMPRSYRAAIDGQFKELFAKRWPELVSRLGILGRLDRLAFLSLAREADVLLDPYRFGLTQAVWQLLPIGTPIVTCPSDQARGRYVSSLYHQLGFTDSIAATPQAYAELAVSLACDPESKTRCREIMATHQRKIFDYPAFLNSLEAFITRALEQAANQAQSQTESQAESQSD